MDLKELSRQTPGSTQRHPWETTRARISRFLIRKVKKHFHHILDIGSGDAYLLAKLGQWELADHLIAVDSGYTDSIISSLRQKHPKIEFRSTTEHPLPDGSQPDLILLMDVLEHNLSETAVLEPVLNDDISGKQAVLLITVPAFQFMYSPHDKALGHYRRYTRKQLLKVCKQQGLQVIRSGYFFASLLSIRLFQKLMAGKDATPQKRRIDNWKSTQWITTTLETLLWWDFRCCYALTSIGIHVPGLSCYCLCQKSPS